uniref:EGF-like domain-containing protein n=1 Tax=Macrostomum lignano TaxID=282301 RepID=A0A1I8GF43_9PLAT
LEKLKESKVRVIAVNLPKTAKSSVDPTMSGLTVISARMPPYTSIPAITKELESTAGCPMGFKTQNDSCTDINECKATVPACHSDATCVNLPGSFMCLCSDGLLHDRARGCPKCKQGYTYDKNEKKCVDVNECKENPCLSDRATCTNLAGSFRCDCPSGFKYNKYFGCVDVDECKLKKDPCMGAGKCINMLGSYNCTCNDGFTYQTGVGCQDVDECKSNATNNCKGGSKCVNIAGSYNCTCGSGYRYSSESCVDIDECAENSKICDASAICVNQKPGYKCQCKLGDNWVYKTGEGCIPDKNKGMADRKVDFFFLIDVSDKLKGSIRDIQGFINGLLQQFNTKEVAGLSARVSVVLMGKKGEAVVAFSQSPLVGIADKINSIAPLGGESNLLQGMKTVAGEKSKARRGSTVVVFLITASSIPVGDSSLTEIKRYSDDFKSNGKFFTVQLSSSASSSQWSVLYSSNEISLYVTVIRSSE